MTRWHSTLRLIGRICLTSCDEHASRRSCPALAADGGAFLSDREAAIQRADLFGDGNELVEGEFCEPAIIGFAREFRHLLAQQSALNGILVDLLEQDRPGVSLDDIDRNGVVSALAMHKACSSREPAPSDRDRCRPLFRDLTMRCAMLRDGAATPPSCASKFDRGLKKPLRNASCNAPA